MTYKLQIPWYIKVLAGVGIGGVILYKTPLLDLLQMFLLVVIIPVLFLSSIGLVGDGLVEALTGGVPKLQTWAQDRIRYYKEELNKDEHDAA